MKRLIPSLAAACLSLASLSATAGVIKVTGVKLLTHDMDGQYSGAKDKQRRPCALIKVKIPYNGAKFNYDIKGVEHKLPDPTGEYYVFFEDGNKWLEISFPECQPVQVNLPELLGSRITAPHTYELTVDLEALDYHPERVNARPEEVMFLFKPAPASIPVIDVSDGQRTFAENGWAQMKLQPGKYEYTIRAKGYKEITDSLEVEANKGVKQVMVAMQRSTADSPITYTVNGASFTLMPVKGGSFVMGDGLDNPVRSERPAHNVTLSDFYLGETEVTQALWTAVMGNNPSRNQSSPSLPVEFVNYNDALIFIEKLNKLTGAEFRLPTEAEWEYAARGGCRSQGYEFPGSNKLAKVAWQYSNSKQTTHPVKQLMPNEIGLYDLCGNVDEWVADYYDENYYSKSPKENPVNTTRAATVCFRGGNFLVSANRCRPQKRRCFPPEMRVAHLGLRLALSPK